MNKGILIGGGIGLAVVGIYFGNQFYQQYQLLQKMEKKFISYKPISINKDSFKLEVDLQIKNFSDLEIKVKGYNFNVYVNNTWVSSISSSVEQTIVPNDYSVLTLLIDVNPSKIGNLDFLTGLLLNYQNATIMVKGKISATAGKISVSRLPITVGPTRLRDMLQSTTMAK